MRAEYVNSFVKAVADILDGQLDAKLRMGTPVNNTSKAILKDTAVLIGITRDIRGQVIVSMSETTSCKIVSRMMGGYKVNSLDDMAKSALGEIGNWILGKAVGMLESYGFIVDITPPTILTGKKMTASTAKGDCLTVPFSSVYGDISIDIAVNV